ncbi:unnamed protein product, partial [Ilex paraguariensis]
KVVRIETVPYKLGGKRRASFEATLPDPLQYKRQSFWFKIQSTPLNSQIRSQLSNLTLNSLKSNLSMARRPHRARPHHALLKKLAKDIESLKKANNDVVEAVELRKQWRKKTRTTRSYVVYW